MLITKISKDDACTECGQPASCFLEDHASGDIICTECGMVQQSHIISTEAEYRVFEDDGYEKIRVGKTHNPEHFEKTLYEPKSNDVCFFSHHLY